MAKIDLSLTIKIGEQEHKISIEEARELHRQLSDALGSVTLPVTPFPINPFPQHPSTPWAPQWQFPVSPTCEIRSVRCEYGYEFPRNPQLD